MNNYLITGASGMIAGGFIQKIVSEHQYVGLILLTRDKIHTTYRYQKLLEASHAPIKIISDLSELTDNEATSVTAVINLAGAPISTGLVNTVKFKELYESRVTYTNNLVKNLKERNITPQVFISASSMAVYSETSAPITETTPPEQNKSKLAKLCDEWEKAALNAHSELNSRVVIMRLGNVTDLSGGMLMRLLPVFQKGYIPLLGNGEQIIPWITLFDTARVISHLIRKNGIEGPVHVCTDERIAQFELFKTLAAVTGMKTAKSLRVPKFLVKAAQKDAAQAVLNSIPSVPEKLNGSGFTFRYKTAADYVRAIRETMEITSDIQNS